MSEQSAIEWTDSTFNPWEGCTKVGPGCANCYAENRNSRFGGGIAHNWGPGAPRRRHSEATWKQPLKWNAKPFVQCPACGWRGEYAMADARSGCCPQCNHLPEQYIDVRRRVFCASLADIFDNEVDDLWRVELFQLILATPKLDWLLLTKRIGNVATMAPRLWMRDGFPANVWLGTTVVNQQEADRDIPKLLQIPARVRFLSVEPMLGLIDVSWALGHPFGIAAGFLQRGMFSPGLETLRPLDWIICGGESGQHARPIHLDWVRSLRDQCRAARVPFLFKQWGEWLPSDEFTSELNAEDGGWPHNDNSKWSYLDYDEDEHQWAQGFDPSEDSVWRVGKKRAGRTLDGRVWNQFPAEQGGGL